MGGTAEAGGVDRVIARMHRIGEALGDRDGVAHFNSMYLAVTEAVREELDTTRFHDPDFVPRLTVVFAHLYLDAYDAAEGQGSVPRAWAPLFDRRDRPGIASVQFAIAGMNAHINYDLGVAVVDTCRKLSIQPRSGTPQHMDFMTMNDVLASVFEQVKEKLLSDVLGAADVALGRLDDVLSMWSIARARDAAWSHAETLWALRMIPPVRDHYLRTLGGTVGFAGRGLLTPVL